MQESGNEFSDILGEPKSDSAEFSPQQLATREKIETELTELFYTFDKRFLNRLKIVYGLGCIGILPVGFFTNYALLSCYIAILAYGYIPSVTLLKPAEWFLQKPRHLRNLIKKHGKECQLLLNSIPDPLIHDNRP